MMFDQSSLLFSSIRQAYQILSTLSKCFFNISIKSAPSAIAGYDHHMDFPYKVIRNINKKCLASERKLLQEQVQPTVLFKIDLYEAFEKEIILI